LYRGTCPGLFIEIEGEKEYKAKLKGEGENNDE
jgi:hypothetical protein